MFNEQNPVTIQDSFTSDMIEKDLCTSDDNFELDDHCFDDDPLCNDSDGKSIMFDIQLYKSVKLDDYFQPSR